MSLKAFHYAFITLSAILALYLISWGFREYRAPSGSEGNLGLGLAVVGILLLAMLIPYFFWVQKKFRKIAPVLILALPAAWLSGNSSAWACSVCFGDPTSTMTQGIKAGIWLLIVIVAGVLGGIAAVGFTWARRAKTLSQ